MSPCGKLIFLEHNSWNGPATVEAAQSAPVALESGTVVVLPGLPFIVNPDEAVLLSPAILGKAKNASFDPATEKLGGTRAHGHDAELLRRLMRRFSDAAATLVAELAPSYRHAITRGRASFRPAEIAGRSSSWRKDDTRLHIDSFPASPTAGRRILRVFTNVNPEGRARRWRVGDHFEAVASRFAPQLAVPYPGTGRLLALLRVTKTVRTAYDALMLQLHDRMKGDAEFQQQSPQTTVDFAPGSTWIAFTDEVSHAAMAGQYQLEQTFLLPITAMRQPERSPLRILERLKRRTLT